MIKKFYNKLLGKKEKQLKKENINFFSTLSKEQISKLQLQKLSQEELEDLFAYSFKQNEDNFFEILWRDCESELAKRRREEEGISADETIFDISIEVCLYNAMRRDRVEIRDFTLGDIDNTEILYSYITSDWKANLYMKDELVGALVGTGGTRSFIEVDNPQGAFAMKVWLDEVVGEYYQKEYEEHNNLGADDKVKHGQYSVASMRPIELKTATIDFGQKMLRMTAEMYLVNRFKDNCILIRHKDDNCPVEEHTPTKCWLNRPLSDYKENKDSFAKAVYTIEDSTDFMVMNDFYKDLQKDKYKWNHNTRKRLKEKFPYEVYEKDGVQKIKIKKRRHLKRLKKENKVDFDMLDLSELTNLSE
jgi:hypothetical protein